MACAGGGHPGRTNTTLLLTNVQPASQGAYDVVITNLVGFAVSSPANLTVGTPTIVLQDVQWLGNGTVRMNLSGVPNRNHAIEISSNLTSWAAIDTLFYTGGLMPYTNATAGAATNRFYRARLLPP